MSNLHPDSEFTGTCKPVKYPCNTGDYSVDPCDCHNYFRCIQETISSQTCSTGTAWDHTTTSCLSDTDVFLKGICNFEQPWYRCNQTDSFTDPLEIYKIKTDICNITNGGFGDITTGTPSSTTQSQNDGVSTTAIAVGVSCGFLGLLIICVIVCIVLRTGRYPSFKNTGVTNKRNSGLTSPPSADNPSEQQTNADTTMDEMGSYITPVQSEPTNENASSNTYENTSNIYEDTSLSNIYEDTSLSNAYENTSLPK